MSFEFPLPDVGEGLTEADIVSWKVAAGDTVTVNQILVEIETAKSLVELPSPQAGTVGALLVDEGQTVEVGTPIIRFGGADDADVSAGPGAEAADSAADASGSAGGSAADASAPATDDADSGATLVGYGARATSSKRRPRKGAGVPAPVAPASQAAAPAASAVAEPNAQPSAASASAGSSASAGKPLAKPPVRKLAKDLGLDLGSIAPTGARGEVTRADVQAAAEGTGAAETTAAPAGAAAPATASAGLSAGELEERIPFKGVAKMMAKAMVDSAFTMPHVTEFLDVDVTETMAFVRRLKTTKFLGEDIKVSPLLIVAKAVAWAVARNPRINSCLEGDEIVVKKYV
ncbi:MAG: biotin/lipoyl-containing protein, partial [Brevibacterium sp.]